MSAYHFGWSDPRVMFMWEPLSTTFGRTRIFYDGDFKNKVKILELDAQIENMNIDSMISLWVVRYGEVITWEELEKDMPPFFVRVGKRLHKLGYLTVDTASNSYVIKETPHGLR